VNAITHYKPIPYRDGYVDLDEWTQEKVIITEMKGDKGDFAPADRALARRRGWLKADGEPNATAARSYREKNRLTWHHNEDGETMQLVPRDLHENVPHVGGASAARSEGAGDVDAVD
jgi:filamentous hemagglutinin